jgi:hypothetical protein
MFRRSDGSGGQRLERPLIRRAFVALSLSIVVVFALYFLLWYWPHRAELATMSDYYRRRQTPTSLTNLGRNVYYAVLGDSRALTEYLFRHTPIIFTLALVGLVFRPRTSRYSVQTYLVAWLLLGWSLLASSSYSPSRYYVTTYPAMASS